MLKCQLDFLEVLSKSGRIPAYDTYELIKEQKELYDLYALSKNLSDIDATNAKL